MLFQDDIYKLAKCFLDQDDVILIQKKDYIANPKPSGYRSLHLIVKVPIYSAEGEQKELVEIQLRTIAMDYWSVLEYELYYKKRDNAEIETELKNMQKKLLIWITECWDYEIKSKKSEQSANARSECLFMTNL